MMKNSYREYFAQCRSFLKMSYFLKLSGVAESHFSLFMKGDAYDYCLSLEKLHNLKCCISSILNEIE